MKILKNIYDKITKIIKLTVIWFTKILFAKSHFKVSLFKRIYFAINGGFTADQIVLYNLNNKNKKEYLSEFDWYKSRYINEPYNFILNNKLVCADLLKQYIKVPKTICVKRNGNLISTEHTINNYDDIIDIIKEYKSVYFKPINIGKGIGVYKISIDKDIRIDFKKVSKNKLIEILSEHENWFISECIEQSKLLNQIYDKTSNTIRLITVRNNNKCEALYAVLRIGTKETIPVDNGSRGGLVAKIDINTGVLSSAKSIQRVVDFKAHPDSNNKIEGVKIKNFDEIKTTFTNLMEKFPYLYFVAWDILLTDNGPVVIEANTSSGVNIIQLWGGQRNKELGNFYKQEKIIK